MANTTTKLKEAKALLDHIEGSYIPLAVLLAELADDMCVNLKKATEDWPLKYRKVAALASIGRAIRVGAVSDTDAKQIGWSKMAMIVPKVEDPGFSELVEFAKTATSSTLKVMVMGAGKASRRTVTFQLTKQEYDALYAALRLHGARDWAAGGLLDKESALMALLARAKQLPQPEEAAA